MICPNFPIKGVKQEFDELVSAVGEPLAYYLWNQNQGYPLTKTSEGKKSKLYNDLVELTGNRIDAMKIKAKTFTESFKEWFGDSKVVDENGEPMIVYHGAPVEKNSMNQDYNFFTESKGEAKTFGNIIHPVFLKIENIKNVDLEEELS